MPRVTTMNQFMSLLSLRRNSNTIEGLQAQSGQRRELCMKGPNRAPKKTYPRQYMKPIKRPRKLWPLNMLSLAEDVEEQMTIWFTLYM